MRLVYEPILPNGYTRLEYLESSGTQYIDTGIYPAQLTKAQIDMQFTSITKCSVLGSNNGASGDAGWNNLFGSNTTGQITTDFWCQWGPNYGGTFTKDLNRHTHIFERDGDTSWTYMVDTTSYTNTSGISTQPTNNQKVMYLFACNNNGVLYREASVKIYSCIIWNNGVPVRDFIPALNSSNVAGMYDRVTGTFYTNAGTGAFNYPTPAEPEDDNVIDNPKYQQVEYLESDSTAYIDTGVSGANNNLKIEMGFSYSKFYAYGYLFSNYESEQHNTTRFLLDASNNSRGLAYINTKSQEGAIYPSNLTKDTFHTFVLTKTSVTIDGNTAVNNNPPVGAANTKSIILFNRGAGTYYEKRDVGMKCYYFRIYDNNILVRHLIPVIRKSDNKPGMYDKITGQFFTNAGPGEFTYGDKINQVLPSKYEKLEYLQSSGTQYIDTGIGAKTGLSVEAKIKYITINGILCGAITTTTGTGDRYYALNFSQSNKVAFTYLDSAFSASTTLTPDEIYTIKTVIDKTRQEMFIDGVSVGYTTKTNDVDLNFTLGLYALHRGGSFNPEWFSEAALPVYYCKIWDGDTLVRYFQPALRKVDNKPGMYDFVSGQFFTNLGTGEFTYDYPAKPLSNSKLRIVKTGGYTIYDDLYKEVEYLESTGTQYIDTGIPFIAQDDYIINARSVNFYINKRSAIISNFYNTSYTSLTLEWWADTSSNYGKARVFTATSTNTFINTASNSALATNEPHDLKLEYLRSSNKINLHYDGNIATNTLSQINMPNDLEHNWCLFLDERPDPSALQNPTRIYYLQIYHNSILVRDFVPVIRIGDNKPGMYDKVNRVFYTNAGTGEFIYPEPTLTKPKTTRIIMGGTIAGMYTPLKYLQSSGTQYIDTGVIGIDNTEFIAAYKVQLNKNNLGSIAGVSDGTNTIDFGKYVFAEGLTITVPQLSYLTNIWNCTGAALGDVSPIEVVVYFRNGIQFAVFDEEYTLGIKYFEGTPNVNKNIYLFKVNNDNTDGFTGKIFYFQLYRGEDELIRNFIPALRKSDNKPGMYDKITGQFFTNSGIGEFTYE